MKRRRFFLYPEQKRFCFALACAAVLLITALLLTDARLRPAVLELARLKATDEAAEAVNKAVEAALCDGGADYSDIINVAYDSSGRVTALSADIIKMNLLKSRINSLASAAIGDLGGTKLSIPVGSACGVSFLSGMGPRAKVELWATGAVTSDFENTFESVGENQTVHRVMLKVNAKLVLVLDGKTAESEVNTQFCAAETVVVGDVADRILG